MNSKLNQKIIENKAIYLNLSLQERTIGLNEIVKDWSSFFGLDIYFWNLAQTSISHLNQKKSMSLADSLIIENTTISAVKSDPIISRPQEVLSYLIEIYHSDAPGIYIIENIDALINSDNIRILDYENFKTWLVKITTKFRERDDFYLIILGNSKEEWKLQNAIPKVRLPFLTIEEVQRLLEEKFTQLKLQNHEKTHLIAKAAHILLGLTRPELEWGIQAIANNLDCQQSVDSYLIELLEYKIEKLKDLGLKFLPPKDEVDVGGMDILKSAIAQMANELAPEARRDCVPIPGGWMLAGVPGAGKSFVARYMAQSLRLPMIYISLDSVITKGAGHLAWMLERIEAAAPVIVYFDEFDKLFPKVETTNTTTIKGLLLTWLQEKRSQCFALVTLNRLDALPPEMTRSGRFDYIWYVGFPQPIERVEIFKYHLKIYDSRFRKEFDYSKEQWQKLLNKSIGFTGAEIESVIKKTVQQKYKLKCQNLEQIREKLERVKALIISWIDSDHYREFEHHYIRDFGSLRSAIACNPEILAEDGESNIDESFAVIENLEKQIKEAKAVKLEVDFPTLLKFTSIEIPLIKRDPEQVNAIENRAKDIGTPVSSKDESGLIDNDGTFWPERPKVSEEKMTLNPYRTKNDRVDSQNESGLTANQHQIAQMLEEQLEPEVEATAGFFD